MPSIDCPLPQGISHEDARAVYAKVRKEMPGLQDSAYRREAARRMGVDYDTYLKAWKKPPKVVEPAPVHITPAPKPVIKIKPPVKPAPTPSPLLPTELTHEKARATYRRVKFEMRNGATDAEIRREAARRLGVDYKTYLSAWKKPVGPKTAEQLATRVSKQAKVVDDVIVNPDDPIWPRFKPDYGDTLLWRKEMAKVNPNRVGSSKIEWDRNCPSATTTMELRMRGYDVESIPMTAGAHTMDIYRTWRIRAENMLTTDPDGVRIKKYGDPSWSTPLYTPRSSIDVLLHRQPTGARGFIVVTWKRGGGGHIFNWVKEEHQYVLVDAQTNSTYDIFDLLPRLDQRVYIARLDDIPESVELDWLTREVGEHRAIRHTPYVGTTPKMIKHATAKAAK